MDFSKSLLIFLVITATFLMNFVKPTTEESVLDDDKNKNFNFKVSENKELELSSLRGTGRFLAQNPRAWKTCDKYPRVCDAKGSAGPDCCRKKCVDVMTDKANCGKCGRKCKYSELCCQGKCVNPSRDEKHCGGCNNKCKKGNSCLYGICSYA